MSAREFRLSRGVPLLPIRPFLEGEVFDPDLIEVMSRALVAACQALRLRVMHDAATRLLAMRIIEQAREGVHDTDLLKAAALKGFGPMIKH
jgi:hypothetical protein